MKSRSNELDLDELADSLTAVGFHVIFFDLETAMVADEDTKPEVETETIEIPPGKSWSDVVKAAPPEDEEDPDDDDGDDDDPDGDDEDDDDE